MAESLEPPDPIVLSASRRTDIPAFFMDHFMDGIRAGAFFVPNPFNGRMARIPADPHAAPVIVFWSKDYGPFLSGGYGPELLRRGYRLLFHFTVNSENPFLEPNVPPLRERLGQIRRLTALVPPEAVRWRFDPLCFYQTADGRLQHNLQDLERIGQAAAEAGIRECITSFAHIYEKVARRATARGSCRFVDPPDSKKQEILAWMLEKLSPLGVRLTLCCQKSLLNALGEALPGLGASLCLSHAWIEAVYGPLGLSHRPDTGQRRSQGCGCHTAKDVGSYRTHRCRHRCLYCYANPVL
uniref:DUF1848 family protein n=1 Tax=Desulfacinum infernum TaxID=35837 RepID=A0A831ZU65_9BACT